MNVTEGTWFGLMPCGCLAAYTIDPPWTMSADSRRTMAASAATEIVVWVRRSNADGLVTVDQTHVREEDPIGKPLVPVYRDLDLTRRGCQRNSSGISLDGCHEVWFPPHDWLTA